VKVILSALRSADFTHGKNTPIPIGYVLGWLGKRTGEDNVVFATGFEFSISACSRSLCWHIYTLLGLIHAVFKEEEKKRKRKRRRRRKN